MYGILPMGPPAMHLPNHDDLNILSTSQLTIFTSWSEPEYRCSTSLCTAHEYTLLYSHTYLLFLPLAELARRHPAVVSATNLEQKNSSMSLTITVTETHMMPELFPKALVGVSWTSSSSNTTPFSSMLDKYSWTTCRADCIICRLAWDTKTSWCRVHESLFFYVPL